MCGSSGACFHGECVAQQTASSAVPACICNALYAGAQCSFRNGNLYFEVPLACTFLLVLVVLGLRVTEKATAMLRLPEHHRAKYNLFAFPRQFVVSERISGVLASCVGTWVGDTSTKGFPILAGGGRKRKQCVVLENIFIVVAVLLELVMWFQIAAIAFLPAVPWPTTSQSTAKVLRLFLLYPLWAHTEAHEFPHPVFYGAIVAVPAGVVMCCLLGMKRFPLFKPQPKDAPVEDLCSMALRVYSEWAALPLMIALLLPSECLFVGYDLKGFVFALPVPKSSCFTLLQGGHVALSLTMALMYWLLSCMIVFQLNCEASHPVPTLWSDIRYMAVVQAVKLPLAMVNGLRGYGSVLAAWSGVMGLVAAAMDNPTNKTTYEASCFKCFFTGGNLLAAPFSAACIWSLGAMGLSEDFWFRLGALTPLKQDSSSLSRPAVLAPDAMDSDEDTGESLVQKIKAFFPLGRAESASKQPRGDARVAVAVAATAEPAIQHGGERKEDKTTAAATGPLVSKLALLRHAKAEKRSASSRTLQ
uniref:EGF-like domain-containing protein n=1 Tax=Globisporangium ultimum (strain ATCC 200006 / CBS 805.95 / DAOM BR144) TaxID=431595 RepID=K3WKS7_GLOUD